jgi:hypothetical protein
MPKRFTLAEAQSLIPRVDPLLRSAISLKTEYADAEASVRSFVERVTMMGGVTLNRQEVRATRERRDAAANRLKATIAEVQELGCQIKDLDIGLIDFPTLLNGIEVCLCWKLGEDRIEYWHGMEEGFRGRKPIDEEFLKNHRGDPPQ